MLYCPHREDYPEQLERLSAKLTVDESSTEPVRLRMGVYPCVDKKLEMERRFENAKAAASAVNNGNQNTIGNSDDGKARI